MEKKTFKTAQPGAAFYPDVAIPTTERKAPVIDLKEMLLDMSKMLESLAGRLTDQPATELDGWDKQLAVMAINHRAMGVINEMKDFFVLDNRSELESSMTYLDNLNAIKTILK